MLIDQKVMEVGEKEYIEFDFTDDLVSGETVPAVGASVVMSEKIEETGVAQVISILDGIPSLSGNVYRQRVKSLVDDVIYIVDCSITTNLGNVYERGYRLIGREE